MGLVLTALIFGFCFWIAFQEVCINDPSLGQSCKSNLQWFLESKPNEKGDALAGIAGSLAFLWIIVTVMIQANELSLQRQELSQTRTALEKQTEYLSNQDSDRKSANIDAAIDAKINLLQKKLPEIAFDKFYLVRGSEPREWKDVTFLKKEHFQESDPPKKYAAAIKNVSEVIESYLSDGWRVDRPILPNSWIACAQLAKEISQLDDQATEGKREEIRYDLQIGSLHRTLAKAIENENLWGSTHERASS